MANLSASDLAGLRIRQVRQQRGWTARELADRCAEAGAPQITATVITNIETRRRASRQITVDELLILARVLEVHPLQLMLPLGAGEELEVAPGVQMDTLEAVKWIGGNAVPLHSRQLTSVRAEETAHLLRHLDHGVPDHGILTLIRLIGYAIWYIASEDERLKDDANAEWAARRLGMLADRLMHLAARMESLGYEPPGLASVREILERRRLPSTLAEWREQAAKAGEPPGYDDDRGSCGAG